MNKVLITLIFSLCIFSIGKAQIRNTTWGNSIEEVKSGLKEPIVKERNVFGERGYQLFVDGDIGIHKANISFLFIDGKLARIVYAFKSNKGYIDNYNDINSSLILKYGDPIVKLERWLDDTFKNSPSMHDYAVKNGHIDFDTGWRVKQTTIVHSLELINGFPYHDIMYEDLERMELLQELILSDF